MILPRTVADLRDALADVDGSAEILWQVYQPQGCCEPDEHWHDIPELIADVVDVDSRKGSVHITLKELHV